MIYHEDIYIRTKGRGFYDITSNIKQLVSNGNIREGICHIFLNHTSASVILCENYDKDVQTDLENFMATLVKDGDPLFRHNSEGEDDMPAHIRTILTKSELVLPIRTNELKLGSWQGIYVWEHRTSEHQRHLTITLMGEATLSP